MDDKNRKLIDQIKASEDGYMITDWKLYKSKQLNYIILFVIVVIVYLGLMFAFGYFIGYKNSYDSAYHSVNNSCYTLIQAAKTLT